MSSRCNKNRKYAPAAKAAGAYPFFLISLNLSCAIENNIRQGVDTQLLAAFFHVVQLIVNKHISYLRMWFFGNPPEFVSSISPTKMLVNHKLKNFGNYFFVIF